MESMALFLYINKLLTMRPTSNRWGLHHYYSPVSPNSRPSKPSYPLPERVPSPTVGARKLLNLQQSRRSRHASEIFYLELLRIHSVFIEVHFTANRSENSVGSAADPISTVLPTPMRRNSGSHEAGSN